MAINSLNNTMVRLSGVSSGLDTDLIIGSMLQLNQARLDKQNQSTTKLEWKADALREVNALIRAFRESSLSVLSASDNMLSAAAYNTFAVTMLTPTNAVTVSAGSQASAGALTIGSISQLAAAANVKSVGAFTGAVLSYDTKLSALEMQNAFEFDEGEISFSINGIVFTLDEEATLGDLLNAVNASDAGVRMTYSSLTKGFAVTAKNTGSTSTVDIPPGHVVLNPAIGLVALEVFVLAFLLVVNVAMPLIASGLLGEVAMGFVVRAIPQMNVFVVGIPLKIAIGFLMLLLILPVFVHFTDVIFERMFVSIDKMIAGLAA